MDFLRVPQDSSMHTKYLEGIYVPSTSMPSKFLVFLDVALAITWSDGEGFSRFATLHSLMTYPAILLGNAAIFAKPLEGGGEPLSYCRLLIT
jgi:hypothetical protein